MRIALALGCVLLAGCAGSAAKAEPDVYQPADGSNLVLEGLIQALPGHHLVVGDLVATPGMVIPPHTHSGEEFLYVIGGSGTLSIPGQPDIALKPGQGVRIAPGMVHGGVAGDQGMRAVSSWIVVNGQPLRSPAP